MNLYDKIIEQTDAILNSFTMKQLELHKGKIDNLKEQLILKSDTAYELGGNDKWAISSISFCNRNDTEDELFLIGPDLNEISEDASYARLTFLNVDDSEWKDNKRAYSSMRAIDYTRYHIHPDGYMMRISTSASREPVRISKRALDKGLDFATVGQLFIDEYHNHKDVKSVKMIYVTDENFPYEKLSELAHKSEQITQSLNEIFNNLIMDCRTCSMKNICDEVEGMKELHMKTIS